MTDFETMLSLLGLTLICAGFGCLWEAMEAKPRRKVTIRLLPREKQDG